jgi:quinoprotein glucose dehydrogenase
LKKQTALRIIGLTALLSAGMGWSQAIKHTISDGEWPYYGGDQANSHYSRLMQIDKSNVQKLQIAWEWKAGEATMPEYSVSPIHGMEGTPLMINDVLYLPTSYHKVVALNANTGKEIWSYDPEVYKWGPGPHPWVTRWARLRGIATWTDGKQRRLLMTARSELIELDAATGKLIPGFGNNGIVDLTEHLIWKTEKTDYTNTSPPVVFKNLVVVGSSVPDQLVFPKSPPGDVQAFDVLTGKFVWSFHTIPQAGEFGNDTWKDDSWKTTGHANVWPPMTLDEKRGLLYLPVTSPANDFYGGRRKGNNLFGDSLVCLDANTGKRIWHFQTVHHDLWDYDGIMTPNLLTIYVGGKTIDAVAAVSKTGFTYVFDRATGKPVWPIVERPVPQTDVPGEETSPSQPFPTKPPAFAKQGFTENDVVDFTPEIKALALAKIKDYRFGPIFNPPSAQGTLYLPSNSGGAEWGSGSVDPDRGILYVRAINIVAVMKLEGPGFDENGSVGFSNFPYKNLEPSELLIPGGIPVNKPPYGTMTAIDLNKGEIIWQVPIGDTPTVRKNPKLKRLDLPPLGAVGRSGSLVTGGGLIFIGPGDQTFVALDKDNGQVLWVDDLKTLIGSTPMTYRTRSGRQFIVVATGRQGTLGLMAFALPETISSSNSARPRPR